MCRFAEGLRASASSLSEAASRAVRAQARPCEAACLKAWLACADRARTASRRALCPPANPQTCATRPESSRPPGPEPRFAPGEASAVGRVAARIAGGNRNAAAGSAIGAGLGGGRGGETSGIRARGRVGCPMPRARRRHAPSIVAGSATGGANRPRAAAPHASVRQKKMSSRLDPSVSAGSFCNAASPPKSVRWISRSAFIV